jgi:hypothetical protein
MWAMALVPLVAGGWLGHRAARSTSRLTSWWTKARIGLLGAALISLVALVLGWLATGGLTPGLLGTVGVEPWRFAGLLGVQVAGGALVVITVEHLTGSRSAALRR